MRLTLTFVVMAALLAVGAGTLVGCGSSTSATDKMGMSDRRDGKMMDGNMMSGDKMGTDAPMNDKMEPAKMDDKMGGDKMADGKMNGK